VAHPNQALRAARRRRPAGAATQQAVADALCDIVQARTGSRPAIDADYISKLERGIIRWPNAEYRAAFRTLFKTTDTDLGFYSARSCPPPPHPAPPADAVGPVVDDTTIARELIKLTGTAVLAAPGPTPDFLTGLHVSGTMPDRVGMDDVRHIDQTTSLFESWDFAFGGGLSRHAVIGQLQWCAQLHQRASTTPRVRTALQTAISRLAEVAGWMSFDAADTRTAHRCWLLGLHMAAHAGDDLAQTNILMDMARATYTQRPQEAISLMGLAQSTLTRATPTVRVAVHVVTARAYGALGAEAECMRQIDTARTLFADRRPDQEPPWLGYYDEGQLSGDCGHALVPLAHKGTRSGEAIGLLRAAVRAHGPDAARSAALSRAKLVHLLIDRDDAQEAADEAGALLQAAPTIRSARLVADLRALAHRTSGRADTTALHENVRGVLQAL
jgi:hypothetical protein